MPLDPEPDRRAIVRVSRDGEVLGVETRIIDYDCVTQAWFHGERTRKPAGQSGATYHNIVLRLETETLDHDRATGEARELWARATEAGIWPVEGTDGIEAASKALWEMMRQD